MAKKDLIYSDQQSMFGSREIIGFGSDEFQVKEIDINRANSIIIKNHYSGKITNHTYIHLGVYLKTEMLGVLQIGYAMNPASGGGIVDGTKSDEFCELNRMWLDDRLPRNSESMAISYAVRYIRSKYPKLRFLMSFADERCGGYGIVYQAANFQYYGEHTTIFWELDGQYFHNVIMTNGSDQSKQARILRARKDDAQKIELRQFRYIYWLNQRYKKECKLKEQPYPKHYIENPNGFEKTEAGGAILNFSSTELSNGNER